MCQKIASTLGGLRNTSHPYRYEAIMIGMFALLLTYLIGRPGNHSLFKKDRRPMALRPGFSPGLPFSESDQTLSQDSRLRI